MSGKPSQATKLVALTSDLLFWHTSGHEAFVTVPIADHLENWPVRSSVFRRYLAREFYLQEDQAPNGQALTGATTVLEGRARFEGKQERVDVRVAREGAFVYLDLGDPAWRVVEIHSTGWRVIGSERAPVLFRRAPGMLELPAPVPGGSLEELRSLVNLESDSDFALIVGWLIAAMRGAGPFLLLILQGEQGSAKSTLSRVLRRLVDPNKADLRAQPRELRDLAIAANNALVLCFDNLSSISDGLSDALCRLATGGGFACRELYTDSDETIFDAMRPLLLNGIDCVATRGDLLDRAIVVNLPRLKHTRTELEFWEQFEVARPRILGALLDAVATALERERRVNVPVSVRMPDAARWVTAGEAKLPWGEGTFIRAYATNRRDANALALESSPIALEVQRLVGDLGSWSGIASELLETLNQRVEDSLKRLRGWPRTPRALSAALRRLAPNLRRVGLEIELTRQGHDRRRVIHLQRAEPDRPHGPQRTPLSGSEGLGGDAARTQSVERGEPSADRPPASMRDYYVSNGADGADANPLRSPMDSATGCGDPEDRVEEGIL
jgi:hypothetical protein